MNHVLKHLSKNTNKLESVQNRMIKHYNHKNAEQLRDLRLKILKGKMITLIRYLKFWLLEEGVNMFQMVPL